MWWKAVFVNKKTTTPGCILVLFYFKLWYLVRRSQQKITTEWHLSFTFTVVGPSASHRKVPTVCLLYYILVSLVFFHGSPIPEHCCFSVTYLGPLVNKLAFNQYKCHPHWEPCRCICSGWKPVCTQSVSKFIHRWTQLQNKNDPSEGSSCRRDHAH